MKIKIDFGREKVFPIEIKHHDAKILQGHYCACRKCCGKWADGFTASGAKATEGVTCAASRNIPFGTKLNIEGVGVRVVQDRLAPKYDGRIDIFFNSHKDALKFGKKRLKVKILRPK